MNRFAEFLAQWSVLVEFMSVGVFVPMSTLIVGAVILLVGASVPSFPRAKPQTEGQKRDDGPKRLTVAVRRSLRFGLVALGVAMIAFACFEGWTAMGAAVTAELSEMKSRVDLAREAPRAPAAESLTRAGCASLVAKLEARSERIGLGCSADEAQLAAFKVILAIKFPEQANINAAILKCATSPVARSFGDFQAALGSARYACAAWERDEQKILNATANDPQTRARIAQDISRVNAEISLRYIAKANADLDAIERAAKQR